MTKDQESGGAPLEQLPDEALCRLIREQDRPAEEVLAARYPVSYTHSDAADE